MVKGDRDEMKLYYCRFKNDHRRYLRTLGMDGRLIPTTSFEEVGFCAVREDIEETVALHPELELCCFDGVCVGSSDNVPAGLSAAKADSLSVQAAVAKFEEALKDLEAIATTMFCNGDDNGTVMEYSGISYDPKEHRVYVDLTWPKRSGGSGTVTAMNLIGR